MVRINVPITAAIVAAIVVSAISAPPTSSPAGKSATQATQSQPVISAEQPLFDFENASAAGDWSALDDSKLKISEPAAKVELASDGATSGKSAMKITFDGGIWPAVVTTKLPQADWSAGNAMLADVTVARPCVMEWRLYTDKSVRGYDGDVQINTRWDKTVFLQAGKNSLVMPFAIPAKFPGNPVSMEIAMYQPHKGESIFVDNVRLAKATFPNPPAVKFSVLGTDMKVSSVDDLAKAIKDKWIKPREQTLDQVETDFRAKFDEFKKSHPTAVLAVLRDGEKGFDPANPDKVFDGWRDTYIDSHPPDGRIYARAVNYAGRESLVSYRRHKSRFLQVDLSVIPSGSEILAAQMVLIRGKRLKADEPEYWLAPHVWVAEACNRPWVEGEVNAYQYAKDKFWKELTGKFWTGDDPDFLPLFVAYGPAHGTVSTWDFTQAVKFWTDGQHKNYGFFWHGDKDYWNPSPTRRAKEIKDRPAMMVIYVPK